MLVGRAGLNVTMWVILYRLGVPLAWLWILVGARIAAAVLLRPSVSRARIGLYLDRVVWYGSVYWSAADGRWRALMFVAAVWAAWLVAASLGRHFYDVIASDAERAEADALARL